MLILRVFHIGQLNLRFKKLLEDTNCSAKLLAVSYNIVILELQKSLSKCIASSWS